MASFFVFNSASGAGPSAGIQIYVANPKPVPSQKQRDDAAAAFARLKKNDFDGAVSLFDKCLDLSNWTASAAVKAARSYASAGQMQKSVRFLDQIVKNDKSSPYADREPIALAWRYIAECAADQNKPDEAVRDFLNSAAAFKDPGVQIQSLRLAASIRRKQKRYNEALDLLTKAAPKGTNEIYWHNERAMVLMEMKKPAEALADLSYVINEFKKRRQVNSDQNSVRYREALKMRIDCYQRLKQPGLAAADSNTLKELNQSWDEDLFGSAPAK